MPIGLQRGFLEAQLEPLLQTDRCAHWPLSPFTQNFFLLSFLSPSSPLHSPTLKTWLQSMLQRPLNLKGAAVCGPPEQVVCGGHWSLVCLCCGQMWAWVGLGTASGSLLDCTLAGLECGPEPHADCLNLCRPDCSRLICETEAATSFINCKEFPAAELQHWLPSNVDSVIWDVEMSRLQLWSDVVHVCCSGWVARE